MADMTTWRLFWLGRTSRSGCDLLEGWLEIDYKPEACCRARTQVPGRSESPKGSILQEERLKMLFEKFFGLFIFYYFLKRFSYLFLENERKREREHAHAQEKGQRERILQADSL